MLILLRDRKPHLPPAQSFYDTAALWPATHEYGIEMNPSGDLLGQLHVDQSSNHLRSFIVQAGHGWGGGPLDYLLQLCPHPPHWCAFIGCPPHPGGTVCVRVCARLCVVPVG